VVVVACYKGPYWWNCCCHLYCSYKKLGTSVPRELYRYIGNQCPKGVVQVYWEYVQGLSGDLFALSLWTILETACQKGVYCWNYCCCQMHQCKL